MTFQNLYEQVLSGIATGKSTKDVATKHGVEVSEIEKALQKGMSVEREHTKSSETAKKIAMDHLWEDPEYYTKLSKMENR